MTTYEKILDAMDQLVLPASTNDIYNRMINIGYAAGHNVSKERSNVYARLSELRKSGKVISTADPVCGTLIWDLTELATLPKKQSKPYTGTSIASCIQALSKDLQALAEALRNDE